MTHSEEGDSLQGGKSFGAERIAPYVSPLKREKELLCREVERGREGKSDLSPF